MITVEAIADARADAIQVPGADALEACHICDMMGRTTGMHTVEAIADARAGAIRVPGADALEASRVFDMMGRTAGVLVETDFCITRAILGGVSDRLPETAKVVFAHIDGVFLALLGLVDKAWREHTVTRDKRRQSPPEYVVRFYVDSGVFDTAILRALVNAVDLDHVMLGSDYPFSFTEQCVDELVRNIVCIAKNQEILFRNATPLFGLHAQEFPVASVEDEPIIVHLRTWFQVRRGDGSRNPWRHHCCQAWVDSSSTWTLGWTNRCPSYRASESAWRTQICASELDQCTTRIQRCRISSVQEDAGVCRCVRLFLCVLQSHQNQGQFHGSLLRDTPSLVLLLDSRSSEGNSLHEANLPGDDLVDRVSASERIRKYLHSRLRLAVSSEEACVDIGTCGKISRCAPEHTCRAGIQAPGHTGFPIAVVSVVSVSNPIKCCLP